MNYYNENDPKAAAWLRELIKANLIATGEVDERSIADVKPNDLSKFTQCHFFAGIGGWSYALRLAGWPDDKPVWTGSCPCQPFSVAGKGLCEKDERHLWPVFRELIRERKPSAVFGEQVASAAGRGWLSGVFVDLEGMAYAVAGADLCAPSVGSPNIRQRVWWMAHNQGKRWDGRADSAESPRRSQSEIGGNAHGLADTRGARCFGAERPPEGETRNEARMQLPGSDGATSGMGNSSNQGLQKRVGKHGIQRGQMGSRTGEAAVSPSNPGRMGNSQCNGWVEGSEGAQRRQPEFVQPSRAAWSHYSVIPCLDGKSRRIESGSFPLAHGVPGRVGLLRGYGNAIVPQVASEFIQASVEAIELAR